MLFRWSDPPHHFREPAFPPWPHRRFGIPSYLSTCISTEVFLAQKKKSWVTSRRKEKNENKIRKAQEMRLEQSAGQLLGNWTIEVAGQIFSLIEDNWIIKLPNADFAQKLTRRFHLNPLLWLKEFLAQPLQNI